MKSGLQVMIVGQLRSGFGEGERPRRNERRLLKANACSEEVVSGDYIYIV
jgi:hypothetical protein